MQTTTPSFSRILVDGRVRAVVLRAAAVPVAVVRRPDPAQAEGLPRAGRASRRRRSSAIEADVRVAGVSVGKVRKMTLDPSANRTLATLEIERKFAPLRADAQAILRQKTLLGETYVELTPGSSKQTIPEGGRLPNGQVKNTVAARRDLRLARPDDARGVPRLAAGPRQGHQRPRAGLQRRARHAAGLRRTTAPTSSQVLDSQQGAVHRLVKNTGVTFGALTENEQQLHNLITSASEVFDATASQQRRARRDDPDLPDVPRRVEGDARAPADVLDQHATRSSTTCARSRGTSSRRCTTCARCRPTCAASSATSTR